jgi:hypothetical protein
MANVLSLDEHVENIQSAKKSLTGSFFEYVDAIKIAHDQLEPDDFQFQLSAKLGMKASTLSRWVMIATSDFINQNKNDMPSVFSTLYDITRLEKLTIQLHQKERGRIALEKLIKKKSITQETEQHEITSMLHQITKQIARRSEKYNLPSFDGIPADKIPTTIETVTYDDCIDADQERFNDHEWKNHWRQMPEFEQEANPCFKVINVRFKTEDDYIQFTKMIGQDLSADAKSIWHPKLDREDNASLRWVDDDDDV